jgi:hypothetical protein
VSCIAGCVRFFHDPMPSTRTGSAIFTRVGLFVGLLKGRQLRRVYFGARNPADEAQSAMRRAVSIRLSWRNSISRSGPGFVFFNSAAMRSFSAFSFSWWKSEHRLVRPPFFPRYPDVRPSVSSITPRCYAATTRGSAATFSDG